MVLPRWGLGGRDESSVRMHSSETRRARAERGQAVVLPGNHFEHETLGRRSSAVLKQHLLVGSLMAQGCRQPNVDCSLRAARKSSRLASVTAGGDIFIGRNQIEGIP